MFGILETKLLSLAEHMPLPFFAPLASIVEEVIAPIPSPIVMIVTGSIASIQERGIYYLLFLTVIASVGKLIGALFVYYIADKVEDIFSGIINRFFGVSHEDIESFGKKFNGSSRDYLIMFFVRAVPIVPSSLVSIGSGILKIPVKVFAVSTFFGTLVRDFIYIYFGYSGISIIGDFIKHSESIESWIQAGAFLTIFVVLVYLFLKRKKNK